MARVARGSWPSSTVTRAAACYRPGMDASALSAHWLGRIGYRDALGSAEGPGDGARRRSHWRSAAAARAPRRPDPRPRCGRIPRPRAPGAAGSARHRAPARGAWRRGDVPRPGTARRLPDHQAGGSRAAAPATGARPRGRPRGHMRRLRVAAGRRDGHPGCWIDPRVRSRARSARWASGSSAERATTASRSTWTWTSRDFGLIDPCGMPGLDSTSIAREAGRRGERPSTEQVRRRGRGLRSRVRRSGSTPRSKARCPPTRSRQRSGQRSNASRPSAARCSRDPAAAARLQTPPRGHSR